MSNGVLAVFTSTPEAVEAAARVVLQHPHVALFPGDGAEVVARLPACG